MLRARPKQPPNLAAKSKLAMQGVAVTPADAPCPTPEMDQLLGRVEQYYSKKILTYGPTPLGVDWSCVPTQEMRFVQLMKVCDFDGPISINDIGCGYGALLAFLGKRHRRKTIDYLGLDISPAMVSHAQKRWKKRAHAAFEVASSGFRLADYAVASGVFNVKLNQPLGLWEQMVAHTLNEMNAASQRGFAVNFLAPMPDGTPYIPELYRVPSEVWCGYCQQTLGAQVELITGYGLREYTLLVCKPSSSAC